MKEYHNFNLLHYNTFGIDARCRRFIEYDSAEEAQQIAHSLTADDMPLLLLGGGSNLLLTADYPGTVVHSAIRYIRQIDDTTVECGSATVWDDFVDYCVSHNLYGAENLSAIPGECGASAVQNIGAYGAEAKDIIDEITAVEIATGQLCHIANSECGYSYRQSRFKHEWRDKFIIVAVRYKLMTTFTPKLDYGNIRQALTDKGIADPTAAEVRQTITDIRNAKLPDPKLIGNAGSFFMNPIVDEETFQRLHKQFTDLRFFEVGDGKYKIPAGWMIDQCGWKGKSLGRAGVYSRQALVLINRGGATGNDIVALMHAIQHDVKEKFGLDIHPEVNIR